VRCPFHGWEFDKSGQCKKIPYTNSIPKQATVKSYPIIEVNKQIYYWFDADGNEPKWQLPVYPQLNDNSFQFHGITSHVIRAHIQEIPENGADIAHFNILHNEFPGILGKVLKHKWNAIWTPGEDHQARIEMSQDLFLFGFSIFKAKVNITQIGPGVVVLDFSFAFGKVIVVETVTPKEEFLQYVTHTIFADRRIPRILAKVSLWVLTAQFERDVAIWNNKTFKPQPLLVKNDGNIAGFRRWYSQFYPKNQICSANLEW